MPFASLSQLVRVMARFAVLTVGLFMLLLIGAYLLAYFFHDSLLRQYRGELEKTYNVKISSGASELNGFTLTIHDVQVQNRSGQPLARVDAVTAPLDVWNTLRYGTGRLLGDITLVGPHLDLIRGQDGKMNWETVTVPPPQTGLLADAKYRGTLRVIRGDVAFRDQYQGEYLAVFDRIGATMIVLPDQSWKAKAEANGGALKLRGSREGSEPIELHVGWKRLALDDWLRHPMLLPYARVSQAITTGQVKITIPPGKLSQALAMGEMELGAGELTIPGHNLTVNKMSGSFRLIGSTLLIEEAKLRWKGQPLRVTGQLRPGGGSILDPYLKLRLQAGPLLMQTLKPYFPQLPLTRGSVRMDVLAEGPWRTPTLRGRLLGQALEGLGQKLRDLIADFELDGNSLHLVNVEGHTGNGGPLQASGYVFLNKQHQLLLHLSGDGLQLGRLSPYLAGVDGVKATVVGPLNNPVMAGHARLDSVPANPAGLTQGDSNFWVDSASALLWGAELRGAGGSVQIPVAVVDYRTGDLAAQVSTQGLHVSANGADANIRGTAHVSGRAGSSDLSAQGYLTDSSVTAPGVPSVSQVEGAVAFQDGQILIPSLQGTANGDRVTVTGQYANGRGQIFLDAPSVDASRYVASLPAGRRSVVAEAGISGRSLDGFRVATRGPGGTAAASGTWHPGQAPEVYAAFTDARVDPRLPPLTGELATVWNNGRLRYFYNAAPDHAGVDTYLFGDGYLSGPQLTMTENYLHLPSQNVAHSFRGYGQAYSYFGPTEGRPIVEYQREPEPWQFGGTLSASGRANLRSRQLDVKLRARNLNTGQIASWFGGAGLGMTELPLSDGLSLGESLLHLDGRAQGTLSNPTLNAVVRSPWTLLSREGSDGEVSTRAVSWRADVTRRNRTTRVGAILSPEPQDVDLLYAGAPQRGAGHFRGDYEADWLRLNLTVYPDMRLAGLVRTEAFPMDLGRFLAPQALAEYLPSGKLATDDLKLSGTVGDPLLAGRVALRDGRFWTGYRYVPVDEAFLVFDSQQRSTVLSDFRLRSGALTLQGRGSRGADGSLQGSVWADALPLETLTDFGLPDTGYRGTVDMAASFKDSKGLNPEFSLALQGQNLLPTRSGAFSVRRLVLGRIGRDPDGRPLVESGGGINYRLVKGISTVQVPAGSEVVFDDPDGSRLAMEGSVGWRALPSPRQSMMQWFTSNNGPRFGQGAQPFRLFVEKFAYTLGRSLLGLPDDGRSGRVSGDLQLLGQWFEQHRLDKPKLSGRPLASLQASEIEVEGPGAAWSGFRLTNPLQMVYEVLPGAGWLRLKPVAFDFYSRTATPRLNAGAAQTTVVEPGEKVNTNNSGLVPSAPVTAETPLPGATATPPPILGPKLPAGTLEASADVVVTDNPKNRRSFANQAASLALRGVPLQNLGFLLPSVERLKGTVDELQITERGPLTQPQGAVTARSGPLQIGGLNVTAVSGNVTLSGEQAGTMRVLFGPDNRVLLGNEGDNSQALSLSGDVLLDFDRLVQQRSKTLLGVWEGWSVSDRTAYNLQANLSDNQMRLLGAIAPEKARLGGRLSGMLALKGTQGRPDVQGQLAMENGSFEHPDLKTPLTGTNFLAKFDRVDIASGEPGPVLNQEARAHEHLNRLTLERLEGALGGQPFNGAGKAEFAGRRPTFLSLNLDGNNLPIRWNGLMDGKATVHLALSGLPRQDSLGAAYLLPHLAGSLDVPQADLRLPDEETLALLKSLGGSGGGPRLSYDVDVHIGEDVWLNALGSSIRTSGNLKVSSPVSGSIPAVNGSVFLSRGVIRVPVYELTFRIRQGYAIFENDVIPRIENLEAESTLGTYQLTIRIDGKYPDLKVSLFSNPPLAQNQVQRLAGGNIGDPNSTTLVDSSFNPSLNDQSGGFSNQGVSLLSNLLTGAVTQNLARGLALSEVSFDILPTSGYQIRLAKALDEKDKFLLTFAQVIGSTRFNQTLSQYGLEYRFQPNLLTRYSLDNYGTQRIWFQGLMRY